MAKDSKKMQPPNPFSGGGGGGGGGNSGKPSSPGGSGMGGGMYTPSAGGMGGGMYTPSAGGMGGGMSGGGKPSSLGGGNYDYTFGMPLTKETNETFGGTKPGKAPTPKPPESPDPFEIIRAQGVENRINEVGPSGSTTYGRDPVTGVWTANREFSPELQGVYDQQVGMMSGDPNAYNQQVADAMFARQRSMLDPVFDQQYRGAEQRLADQGLPMEGEAYRREFDRMDRMKNEAYGNAANQATLTGTQAGMQQRQSEFNQMAALLGGQQVGPTSPIDVTGPFNAQQQGQWNAYTAAANNASSRNQQTTAGATALASTLAMMMMVCSRDAKENNAEIDHDDVLNGLTELPVERWTYKEDGNEHLGPYAEDFQRIFGLGDGKQIAAVDAIGVCMSAIKSLVARVEQLERRAA